MPHRAQPKQSQPRERISKPAAKTGAKKVDDDAKTASTVSSNTVSVEDACICDWPDCKDMRQTLKKKKHVLGGDVRRIRYSDTCNFLNLWGNVCINLNISPEEKKFMEEEYENAKENGGDEIRICIARHHWPEELTSWMKESKKNRIVTPLTPDEVEEGGLLPEMYKTDGRFKYDSDLGPGRPDKWKLANPTMYIKSPCNSRQDVKALVDSLTSTNRRDIRRAEEETRPPTPPDTDDWRERLAELEEALMERDETVAERDEMIAERDEMIAERDERIEELEAELAELRLTRHRAVDKKQQQAKRAKRAAAKTAEELAVHQVDSVLWSQIMELISNAGGLSRLTIFCKKWHAQHLEAAEVLFGARTFAELLEYVHCYFPQLDMDVDLSPIQEGEELKMPPLTELEKCLLCRMFFHLRHKQKLLALIIDRHRTTVGNIIKEWAPRWGEIGEFNAILDITEDYLMKEEPDKIAELFLEKIVFNDGKDWRSGSKWNDNVVSKQMYSSKNDCDSFRGETWTSAAGLGFEHTRLFAARISENSLQRIWGSLGLAKADVASWEDVAKQPAHQPDNSEIHWTALDDMLTASDVRLTNAAESVQDMLEDVCLYAGEGVVHDDVVGTAKATAMERMEMDDNVDESVGNRDDDSEDESSGGVEKSRVFSSMADLKEWARQVKVLNAAEEEHNSRGGNKKMAPLLSPERLEELVQKALRLGPNSSGWKKLRQQEMHERLHRSYEAGRLHKCLLSNFLLCTTDDRHKLLAWMGSSMVPNASKPTPEELPTIYLRLAKIPPSVRIGTDKGFAGTDRDYPWHNRVLSPTKLADMKGYRRTPWHIRKDRPLCSARFSSETHFFRVDDQDIMKDTIPYWCIPVLPHAHAFAHGEANLCMPFRKPGKNSIVGDDYWENKKDYTRIAQRDSDGDVEMLDGQVSSLSVSDVDVVEESCACCRGTGWGVLYRCNRCNKSYHNDCHNIDNCNPYNVNNN